MRRACQLTAATGNALSTYHGFAFTEPLPPLLFSPWPRLLASLADRMSDDVPDIMATFLGLKWMVWVQIVGWMGNATFSSRFIVQWLATEKHRQVVVPTAFWWLSLMGSSLLLIYSALQRDLVFIFAYLFTWIPYSRNLVIHYRHRAQQRVCKSCNTRTSAHAKFCHECGEPVAKLAVVNA